MEHHPIADLFPMLPEDELKELAADIAERGILQPIVLDGQGRILDGRNRYAACGLAGVEAEYETYDGDDPDGYALAVNVQRRSLSKGQKAMVVARAFKETLSAEEIGRRSDMSGQRIRQASAVLAHAPDLVDDVIAGTAGLDEAYKTARKNKDAAEERDHEREQLAKLAPDLAVLVDNGVRGLADALAEAEDRKIVREIDAIRDDDGEPPPSFSQRAEDGSMSWGEAKTLAEQWQQERAESINRDYERVKAVIAGGWGAFKRVAGDPDHPYSVDVLAKFGADRRDTINQTADEMRKETAQW